MNDTEPSSARSTSSEVLAMENLKLGDIFSLLRLLHPRCFGYDRAIVIAGGSLLASVQRICVGKILIESRLRKPPCSASIARKRLERSSQQEVCPCLNSVIK